MGRARSRFFPLRPHLIHPQINVQGMHPSSVNLARSVLQGYLLCCIKLLF
jgi:hypothetical protein